MSRLVTESPFGGGTPVPVIYQGKVTELAVATGSAFCFVEFGPAPTAQVAGQRVRIPAGVPEYFGVNPKVDRIAAYSGAVGAVSAVLENHTTCVRVIYDDVAGVLEIMEGAK
jgi:hypothetical protein